MIRSLLAALGTTGAAPIRRLLALLAAAATAQGVAYALLVPLVRALLGPHPEAAMPWLAGLAAATLAYAALTWYAQNLAYRTGAGLARVLHHRLGDKIIQLPLGWFSPARLGELSRMASQNVLQLMNVPAHLLRPVITATVTPLVVVLTLFLVDVRLAVAVAIAAPILVAVLAWSNRRIGRTDASRHRVMDEAAGRIVEYAQAQPVLRAYGRTTEGYRLLDDALLAEQAADRALLRRAVPGIVAFGFAVRALLAVLLILGVDFTLAGSLATPTLVAALILAVRFTEPLSAAADLGAALRMATGNLTALNRVFDAATLPTPATPTPPKHHGIELRDVHFGYGDQPVLHGITLTLPPNSMTALVGPSGAGKTTIARLIARFWDTDSGTVRIGDVDVRDIDPDALMSMISFVFQDVYLFDGTLADNIRLGHPDATDQDVHAAAATAGLSELLDELPAGLETPVGEAGRLLSGGQRQRVSIARAILKQAPIVILDEATAALDAEADAAVQTGLHALAHDTTLLVIAHRLHTVRAADQILVVDNGRITEQGRHTDLLDADGTYAQFWRERSEAAGWRLANR